MRGLTSKQIEAVVAGIKRVADEIGWNPEKDDYLLLARELESRGIGKPGGGPWYYPGKSGATALRRVITEHIPNWRRDKVDNLKQDEPLTALKRELARLSERVARIEAAGSLPTAHRVDNVVNDMPLPKRKGHALQGAKEHIRVRIDKELRRHLKELADREFQGNEGLAVDFVLWCHFDRPKLSFEIPEKTADRS